MGETLSFAKIKGSVRERLDQAAEFLRGGAGRTLFIPAGEYILEDARAKALQNSVMSGELGNDPQWAMFAPDAEYSRGLDLAGCENATIEATGATLVVDGFMEPVSVRDCSGVTIRGLSIDHLRKPFSEGAIIGGGEGYADVLFDAQYPLTEASSQPRCYYVEPASNSFFMDRFHASKREMLSDRLFRYEADYDSSLLGQRFCVVHTFHFRPAILIERARNTLIEDVTIHSQPGMGVVGFKSDDITLNRVRIVPSLGARASVNTDATHFACCRGELRVENCVFEGQGDDAINVHSYYYKIENASGRGATLSVEVPTHSLASDIPVAGMKLALVRKRDLAPIAPCRVLESDGRNPTRVVLDADISGRQEDCFLANLTDMPRLTFKNNVCKNHRARGVLVKCDGAVIENCLFRDIDLSAVHVAAEADWREGIAASEVKIAGCEFINCGRGWPASAVRVNMYADDPSLNGAHKNIEVTDNRVVSRYPNLCAFEVSNTCGARVSGNSVTGAFERVLLSEHSSGVEFSE